MNQPANHAIDHPAATVCSAAANGPWEQLMAASMAGDAKAYRRLLSDAARWLKRYYARRLPADCIDDAVQEALTALHTRRASFTPGRPFLPWLAAIARFKWVDSLRAMKHNQTDELGDPAVPGHEHAVTSSITLAALLAGIRGSQADAIRRVKLEGYSVREASLLTGQSEALIKVNIHRGLAGLRALLGEGAPDLALA